MERHLTALWAAALAGLVLSNPANAQDRARQAVGADVYVSSDSDSTRVVRAGIEFDLRNEGDHDRLGVRFEKAWYDPGGSGTVRRDRAFLQFGHAFGGWQVQARVGTDGHSVIGAIDVNDQARFRKELFVERDVVETRRGVTDGIYSTYAGGALDLPVNERNVCTLLAGVQAFTGDNVRLHVRGNFVHVLAPSAGLSAQLRTRYFHDSDPREFDYYSPRYYAQILPVLQMRRFVGGWQLLGAGGIGIQRDSSSGWHRTDFAEMRVSSPSKPGKWSLHAQMLYSNAPSATSAGGPGYRYVQGSLGVTRRF